MQENLFIEYITTKQLFCDNPCKWQVPDSSYSEFVKTMKHGSVTRAYCFWMSVLVLFGNHGNWNTILDTILSIILIQYLVTPTTIWDIGAISELISIS